MNKQLQMSRKKRENKMLIEIKLRDINVILPNNHVKYNNRTLYICLYFKGSC
jgi:hypothetical protein